MSFVYFVYVSSSIPLSVDQSATAIRHTLRKEPIAMGVHSCALPGGAESASNGILQ